MNLFFVFSLLGIYICEDNLKTKIKPYSQSVFIECLANSGKKVVSTGTGFFVKYKMRTYFITNLHIISGREINGKFKNEPPEAIGLHLKKGNLIKDTAILVSNNWGQYRDKDGQLFDIAAVEIPSTLKYDITCFKLDNLSDNSNYNINCSVVGFPRSYIINPQNYYKPKFVSTQLEEMPILLGNSISKNGGALKWNRNLEPGLSGSPVINEYGNLIGIYSTKYESLSGIFQTFGFYWNISSIIKVLENGNAVFEKSE